MEWLLMLLPCGLLLVLLSVALGGVRGAMADPEPFVVQFELGGSGVKDGASFLLRVEPSWAPRGAKRFRELVEAGFYDDTRFFRVLDGMYDIWIAQFGIHGDPAVHAQWEKKRIRDDPVTQSNKRGTIAFAMSGPNTRTTQLFLNFGDGGPVLDNSFAPFGEVIEGMEVVDSIYKIGEGPPSGKGPAQHDITQKGNAYLDKKFPDLTKMAELQMQKSSVDASARVELQAAARRQESALRGEVSTARAALFTAETELKLKSEEVAQLRLESKEAMRAFAMI